MCNAENPEPTTQPLPSSTEKYPEPPSDIHVKLDMNVTDIDAERCLPFGMDGTSALVSQFGELLHMSKYLSDSEAPGIFWLCNLRNYGTLEARRRSIRRRSISRFSGIGLYVWEVMESVNLTWVNDRWPRLSYQIGNAHFEVQWVVHNGIVLQRYTVKNKGDDETSVDFRCNMSTIQGNVGMMRASMHDTWAENSRPLDAKFEDGAIKQPGIHAETTMHIFIDEQCIPYDEFINDDEWQCHTMRLKPEESKVISAIYRIDLLRKRSESEGIPKNLDVESFLEQDLNVRGKLVLNESTKFDAHFRRHLEHLLCVCSVPISRAAENSNSVHEAADTEILFERPEDFEYVDFTDGNVMGPFSAPNCQLFIFQYLLRIYIILRDNWPIVDQRPPLTARLFARIQHICTNHLNYCFRISPSCLEDSMEDSKAKTNGTRSGTAGDADWTYDWKEAEVTSTSDVFLRCMDVLKLSFFIDVFGEVMAAKVVDDTSVRKYGQQWIQALQSEKNEKSRLWHATSTLAYVLWEGNHDRGPEWIPIPKYRLGDLIYLWKALLALHKRMEKWSARAETPVPSNGYVNGTSEGSEDEPRPKDGPEDIPSYFKHCADEIRAATLERFNFTLPVDDASPATVIDNVRSNDANAPDRDSTPDLDRSKPSLLVGQSRAARRFLFYAKDTMLHDGYRWGFFDADGVDTGAWGRLVKLQCDDNEGLWDNPLRYALQLVMSKIGVEIGSSTDLDSHQELCRNRLLLFILPSGLFAERIHWQTKSPAASTGHGNFQAMYEIPVRLLEYYASLIESAGGSNKEPKPYIITQEKKDCFAKQRKELMRSKRQRWVHIPDGKLGKESCIPAWLCTIPKFFKHKPPGLRIDDIDDMQTVRLTPEFNDHITHLIANPEKTPYEVIKKGAEVWRDQFSKHRIYDYRFMLSYPVFSSNCPSLYIDIPGIPRNEQVKGSGGILDLYRHLEVPRTPLSAKKRFIYCPHVTPEFALAIYFSEPPSERRHTAEFLNRHDKGSNHLHENVHPVADVWTTELHLSFIQIVDEDISLKSTSGADSMPTHKELGRVSMRKSSESIIAKASLSYLFSGDMNDRFWTGYVLLTVPEGPSRRRWPAASWEEAEEFFASQSGHTQRKVLEPYVVAKMATEIYVSTEKTLKSIGTWLDEGVPELEGEKSSKDLFNSYTNTLKVERMLQLLHRRAIENRDILKRWLVREQSRHYNPRWTVKDEERYGEQVSYHHRQVEKRLELLEKQYEQIPRWIGQVKSHSSTLSSHLQLREAKTATQSADNVMVFTYATVVFLPLSFVSSLFSMQGAPSQATVLVFGKYVAIALFTTLILLINAQSIRLRLWNWTYKIRKQTHQLMESSTEIGLHSWPERAKTLAEAEHGDILRTAETPRADPHSEWYYFLFWITYVLIELPARGVAKGFIAVRYATSSTDSSQSKGMPLIPPLVRVAVHIGVGLLCLIPVLLWWPLLFLWTNGVAVLDHLRKWKSAEKPEVASSVQKKNTEAPAGSMGEPKPEGKKRQTDHEAHNKALEEIEERKKEEAKELEQWQKKLLQPLVLLSKKEEEQDLSTVGWYRSIKQRFPHLIEDGEHVLIEDGEHV